LYIYILGSDVTWLIHTFGEPCCLLLCFMVLVTVGHCKHH